MFLPGFHHKRVQDYKYSVDPKRKFIFFHIAKTGGSSIGKVLFGPRYEHVLVSLYRLEKECGIKADRFFKFVIARNPWDRMLSQYYQVRQACNLQSEVRRKLYEIAHQRDFSDWLIYYAENYSERLPWFSVSHMLTDAKGQFAADYVIRFENLQEGANEVFRRLGIPLQTLPHLNKSEHGHYREHYTQKAKAIIERCYADDLRRFQYPF